MTSAGKFRASGFYNQFLHNKYWYAGSVLFFLIATFFFVKTLSPHYEVSSKIEVNKAAVISPGDLKSPALLQKTLDRLPFRVDYLQKRQNGLAGISQDSLPIRLVVNKDAPLNTKTRLEVAVISNQQFQITEEDTITSFRFNESVNQPFGKFKIAKGPLFSVNGNPTILKFHDETQLLEDYKDNLDVKPVDGNNTLQLSVEVPYPQKGVDFLNKLLEVYSSAHTVTVHTMTGPGPVVHPKVVTAAPVAAVVPSQKDSVVMVQTKIPDPAIADSLKRVKKEIAILEDKSDDLHQKLIKDKGITQVTVDQKSDDDGTKRSSDPTVRALMVIKNYVNSPVEQFVQVPYTDKIKDDDLRDMVERFNKTEVDKQKLLTDSAANMPKIKRLNQQIDQLKGDITENIKLQTNEEDDRDPLHIRDNPKKHKTKVIVKSAPVDSKIYDKDKAALAVVSKQLDFKKKDLSRLNDLKQTAMIVKTTSVTIKVKTKAAPVKALPAPVVVKAEPITAAVLAVATKISPFKILTSPENNIRAIYPSGIPYYIVAIVIGLIVAMLLVYIKNIALSISWSTLIDLKKLNEKLAALIASIKTREID